MFLSTLLFSSHFVFVFHLILRQCCGVMFVISRDEPVSYVLAFSSPEGRPPAPPLPAPVALEVVAARPHDVSRVGYAGRQFAPRLPSQRCRSLPSAAPLL